jgi:probable addiction module antidote protein
MPKRVRNYEETLSQRLQDPEYAAGYLNAVLEDKGSDQKERFLLALRDVAKAHGMTKLASDTKMAREAMYRALSETGNPEFDTLTSLLDAVGLQLAVETKKKVS